MSSTTGQAKDVIYIDVDEDITGIIGKLQDSSGKIVALVLPKRAAVLQSIVNLKLLKRTADETKKNLVLITSESALLPLAGAVGVHVAKTLQSKPSIPAAPKSFEDTVEVDESDAIGNDDNEVDVSKPVGELAGLPPKDDDETIDIDNDDEDLPATTVPTKAKKPKLNNKLKVPNFDAFRTRLIIGVAALVLLIVGWFVAFRVLPTAHIVIKTDNSTVTSDMTITASPKAKTLSEADQTVPAEAKQLKKSDSQNVPTTGQKDVGTKATGNVTLTLADCAQPQVTVPAGTAVSSGGLNLITQVDVTLQSVRIGTTCRNSDFPQVSTGKVKVEAQNAGDQYNLSARNYTVTGFSNVSAAGTAMAGGTSKVIKIVSQADIDGAKQKMLEADNAAVNQEISDQLKADGYIPIVETISASNTVVTATPNVGEESDQVAVSVTTTYEMIGAKKDDVKTLLEADIKKHIDTSKQNILDNGLDKAVLHATENKLANGNYRFTLQTTAEVGVQQDANAIKKAIAGKKKGEVQAYISARPGVKDVQVSYSPFWIYRTTKSTNKITITFQQANGNTSNK